MFLVELVILVWMIIAVGGGEGANSRGLSINESDDVTIESVDITNYTGSGINISGCNRVNIGQFRGYRDYINLGWTSGKSAIRLTNQSKNVSVGTVVSDGWSRGVFILTGSENASISSVMINNCESQGVWVEGDDGGSQTGSGSGTISSGYISNTGLGGSTGYSVYLTATESNIISGIVCDNDIVEENINSNADKNIITSNRTLGSITKVGPNTITSNNIEGA